jgi:hypothetical protein
LRLSVLFKVEMNQNNTSVQKKTQKDNLVIFLIWTMGMWTACSAYSKGIEVDPSSLTHSFFCGHGGSTWSLCILQKSADRSDCCTVVMFAGGVLAVNHVGEN